MEEATRMLDYLAYLWAQERYEGAVWRARSRPHSRRSHCAAPRRG